ncbi:hypothetical protein RBB50_002238 [Rhinocladiella similis]
MNAYDQAIARTLITATVPKYAWHAREKADWDKLAECFEPDAIYRLGDGRELLSSRAKEVVRGKEAKYIRHNITHTNALFFATTENKVIDHWGHWSDIFHKQQDGSWLISERSILTEGKDPEGWSAKVYADVPASVPKAEQYQA